jgi:hypothetical protein
MLTTTERDVVVKEKVGLARCDSCGREQLTELPDRRPPDYPVGWFLLSRVVESLTMQPKTWWKQGLFCSVACIDPAKLAEVT